MSRGLGQAERGVLAALRASGAREMTSRELARALYGEQCSHAEDSAMRRAVRSLERKGLVQVTERRTNVVR